MPEVIVCLAALAIASLAGGLLLWARRRGDAAVAREQAAVGRRLHVEVVADTSAFDLALARFELAAVHLSMRMRRMGRAIEDVALHTGSLRTWTPDEEEETSKP